MEKTTSANTGLDPKDHTKYTLEQLREKQGENRKERFPAPAPTILPEAYAKKLSHIITNEDLIRNIVKDVSRTNRINRPSGIDYETGKKIVWAAYKTILTEQGKTFVAEEGQNMNKEVIPNLIKYFLGLPCDLDPKKGILLVGNVGTGKTLLFRIMRSFVNQISFDFRKFSIVNVGALDNQIVIKGDFSPLKKVFMDVFCFDDLGVEKTTKVYGTSLELVNRIILTRYDLFENTGTVTHATSNLPLLGIKDNYDDRIHSRCNAMFNEVILSGVDKRKI